MIGLDAIDNDASLEFLNEGDGRVRIFLWNHEAPDPAGVRDIGAFYTRDLGYIVAALSVERAPAPVQLPPQPSARLKPGFWDRLLGRVEERS